MSWEETTVYFTGRTPGECRRRYKILRPQPKEAAKEETWTADKKERLVDLREKQGMAWYDVARWMSGRRRDSCKQQYMLMFPEKGTRRPAGPVVPKKATGWRQAVPKRKEI